MKSLLFSLLFASLFSVSRAQVLETPTGSSTAAEQIDPNQKGKDFKVWRNLLKFYVNCRQAAKASLEDLQAVSDFAWAAHKYLAAIERASQNAEIIMNNIRDFRTDNPVQMVKDAELKVFRKTDDLFYSDIPNIRRENENMAEYRERLMDRSTGRLSALTNVSVRLYKGFEKKFFKVQLTGALDDSQLSNPAPDPALKGYIHATHAASENIAAADVRNQQLATQNAQLTGVLRNASPTGKVTPEHQAQMNLESNRNALILNIQEHEHQSAAVNNAAWLLVTRASKLDNLISQKSLLISGATLVSEELERQRSLRP